MFFALPNFKEAVPLKVVARHVVKFHNANPPRSEDRAPNTLKFKPILDPPLKIIVRGPLSMLGVALVRLGHSLACINIWGTAPLKG